MKIIESEGKTREEAIQNGLKALGVDMHDVEKIDVIGEGSKGFLGFGSRPWRIRLTATPVDSGPQRDRPRRDRPERRDGRQQGGGRPGSGDRQQQGGNRNQSGNRPQQGRPQSGGDKPPQGSNKPPQNRTEERAPGDRKEENRRNKNRKRGGGGSQENRADEGRRDQRGDSRKREDHRNKPMQGNAHKAAPIVGRTAANITEEASAALKLVERFENEHDEEILDAVITDELPPDAQPEEIIETISDDQGREAAAMLSEVIVAMDLAGSVSFARVKDGSARLTIDSPEDGGILIGKRGVTLSAIQYLINRMIDKTNSAENTECLVVDVGGYVDRRAATLVDMAHSMAKRAKETRRIVRLKPLSPQERRIIHLALEKDPQVRTYSLGDSLFRSIVINPVGGRRNGPPKQSRSAPHRSREQESDVAHYGD